MLVRIKRIAVVLTLIGAFCMSSMSAQEDSYLYKCLTVRAAPGKLPELIDHLKADLRTIKDSGEEPGYMFRHHQGDQWDIMLMIPIGDYETYFGKSKAAKILERKYGDPYYDNVAFQEEGFVRGPALGLFRSTWQNNTYFHSEMFISLGGKQKELYKEREMENIYSTARGSVYNMIFTRENGFKWDIFTLGAYRDFQHYSDTNLKSGDRMEAAKLAGFESPDVIGFVLRSLILEHIDTIGGKVDY